MSVIGKLEKVSVRSVWRSEPEFTRWLEQNPDLLNEALGITVQSLAREQSAGDFFVDLVGEDAGGGQLIVENQFGRSDHDHLGKILTYLAAFEATTAVWIVETPRPEHVKVFAWLNDSSSASFYLVQMQALRIGQSPPAPLLNLIVGPSEGRDKVTNAKRELAERDRLQLQFWMELIGKLKENGDRVHSHLRPAPGGWISAGAGISGVEYTYVVGNTNARIELYIDKYDTEAENRLLFDTLLRERGAIEEAFGGQLDWQELEGKRAKRIAWRTDRGGLKNPEVWPELQEELAGAMARFVKALKPHIAALKAAGGASESEENRA